MASGVGPISYKRVMVLGAKRTGKSSLLGAALNGDMGEGQMYNPTLRVERWITRVGRVQIVENQEIFYSTPSVRYRFYDVDRKLQFIDTPGLDSQILLGDLLEFNKDPVVKEFLDEVEYEKKEILKDVQIPAISAFVIVFCADDAMHIRLFVTPRVTERMAEALYNAISLKNDKADGSKLQYSPKQCPHLKLTPTQGTTDPARSNLYGPFSLPSSIPSSLIPNNTIRRLGRTGKDGTEMD
eukprot:1320118-Amorphochlora_amoeboformis.AAC.3